jgi:hypothetical protein
VGHMQMTNSSTLEESCLAPSVAGSARLSTASWRRSQPTILANRGAHPARCFAIFSGWLGSQSINDLLVASSCFRCSLGRHFDAPSDCRCDGAGHTQCRWHKAARYEVENSRICRLPQSSFVGHGLRHGDTREDPATGVNIAGPAFRKLTDEKQEPHCNDN